MTDDCAALDLDALYLEHYRCGDLDGDVVDESRRSYVLWMDCLCGGRFSRRCSLMPDPQMREDGRAENGCSVNRTAIRLMLLDDLAASRVMRVAKRAAAPSRTFDRRAQFGV